MTKIYIHFVPNLSSGGAETFLLRLIDDMPGNHTVVTFWRDKNRYHDIIPRNAKHISINPLRFRFGELIHLYITLQRLSSSDRVLSWLYMSDFIASIFWLLSFSKFNLTGIFATPLLIDAIFYFLFFVFIYHVLSLKEYLYRLFTTPLFR